MRSTTDNLFFYWLIGAFLIWLILPTALIDLLIAPEWFAPNWQCDSLGIPIMETQLALLPWAGIAAVVSGIAVLALARNRQAGANIFDLRLGRSPWNWIIGLLVLALCMQVAFDIGRHLWAAAVPQTISSDCSGRAELVVVTMRGPILQLLPLLEINIALWALHLRALFLSPRKH